MFGQNTHWGGGKVPGRERTSEKRVPDWEHWREVSKKKALPILRYSCTLHRRSEGREKERDQGGSRKGQRV